jgi:hypothetical protein
LNQRLYSDAAVFFLVVRVSRGFAREIPIALLLVIFAFGIAVQNAGANPIAPGPDYSSAAEALSDLFISNLPIDLFWFAVVLYFVFRFSIAGKGKIAQKTSLFMASVLLAAVVIAVVGAFIDFYAFYDGNSQDGYAFWTQDVVYNGHTYYWPRHDSFLGSSEFYLALAGIFASIFLISFIIVRMNWKQSLIPAAVMTALNPIAWVVLLDADISSRRLLIFSAIVMATVSVAVLALWHSRLSEGSIKKDESAKSTE